IPFVPGVQASASRTSESCTGDVIAPQAISLVHPGWPKSHDSRCAFFIPQLSIVLTDHSPAALRLGEPVSRGPYTSVRKCSVRISWECCMPSSRMRELRSVLMCSSAAGTTAKHVARMPDAITRKVMNAPAQWGYLGNLIYQHGSVDVSELPAPSFRLPAKLRIAELELELEAGSWKLEAGSYLLLTHQFLNCSAHWRVSMN